VLAQKKFCFLPASLQSANRYPEGNGRFILGEGFVKEQVGDLFMLGGQS
jgi:hypothetical protein